MERPQQMLDAANGHSLWVDGTILAEILLCLAWVWTNGLHLVAAVGIIAGSLAACFRLASAVREWKRGDQRGMRRRKTDNPWTDGVV